MKTYLLAAALVCGSAFYANAQMAATPSDDPATPAVAMPETVNPTAPVAGANSFTEAQAIDRMTDAGFTSITDIKLDDAGLWQAMAMSGGKPVAVALDYQGNIVATPPITQ